MTATFRSLLALDDHLVAAGHHRLTPFWRVELERFYAHRTARTFVGQIGRGGAKSHTSAKVALNETINGDWKVPPGERHYFAFISASKDEAAQRLLLLESFLGALGVPYDRQGDTIALRDSACGFRVFAQHVAAVSGFRCIGYAADELAKWRNAVDSRNPAAEVIASINAMTITHTSARALLISSPWSTETFHYRRMQLGDTDAQITAQAPSYVANPAGITEEETRHREPDEATRKREYDAIASATLTEGFFPEAALQRSIDFDRTGPEASLAGRRFVLAIDPAFALGGDEFAFAALTSEVGPLQADGSRLPRWTVVHEADSWRPEGEPTKLARRLKDEFCTRYNTFKLFSDQHEGYSFSALARTVGLTVEIVKWTGGDVETSKTNRFRAVRAAMLDGRLRLPNDERLLSELRAVSTELSANGNELIRLPHLNGHHCDRAAAVVLGASIALKRSPTTPTVELNEPKVGSPEWYNAQAREMRAKAIQQSERTKRAQWATPFGRQQLMRKIILGRIP